MPWCKQLVCDRQFDFRLDGEAGRKVVVLPFPFKKRVGYQQIVSFNVSAAPRSKIWKRPHCTLYPSPNETPAFQAGLVRKQGLDPFAAVHRHNDTFSHNALLIIIIHEMIVAVAMEAGSLEKLMD
jgi:hypothetical protein